MFDQNAAFSVILRHPEIARSAVMLSFCIRLFLRNVEDVLHDRGINMCHGDRQKKPG